MHLILILACIVLSRVASTLSDIPLDRSKRWIVYPYGGQAKVIVGVAWPITLGTKQSMSCSVNLQFEYPEPTNITQIQRYPPSVAARSRHKRHEMNPLSDRVLAYRRMEQMLESYGMDGRNCLLRSICENAMDSVDHDGNGIFGRLLHIFLSPDYGDGKIDTNLDAAYIDAQKAGYYGADCLSLYPKCPYGESVLDIVSVFI